MNETPAGLPGPGERSTLVRVIDAHDEDRFIAVSRDQNLLHTADSYAVSQGFTQRLAHGLLVASAVLPAIGELLRGRAFICLTQQIRYTRAVYPGDELHITAEVRQVAASVGVLVIATTIADARGTLLLDGEVRLKVLGPQAGERGGVPHR